MVVPIGENVWYKEIRVGTGRKNEAETEWYIGIWLGPAASSSETLIGTSAGVLRASAIKKIRRNGEMGYPSDIVYGGYAAETGPE